jgi:hypothetical protein
MDADLLQFLVDGCRDNTSLIEFSYAVRITLPSASVEEEKKQFEPFLFRNLVHHISTVLEENEFESLRPQTLAWLSNQNREAKRYSVLQRLLGSIIVSISD